MRSHDLANYLEYKVTRKKVDPMSKKKMSTFELNTIIAKVRENRFHSFIILNYYRQMTMIKEMFQD